MSDEYKVMPANKTAEQAVIGGLLIDGKKLPEVLENITSADFYFNENRLIFEQIESMADNATDINVISIADKLPEQYAYIAGLARDTYGSSSVVSYSIVIMNKSKERQLISAAYDINQLAYDNEKTTEEKIMQSQAALLGMESNSGEESAQANAAIRQVIENIDERFQNKGKPIGLTVGLKAIDNKVGGFRDGNLIILAARPAMGKTTLAMNFAENAIMQGDAVQVFSAEMTRDELMERMVASTGGIYADRVRRGTLEEDDWPKLSSAVARLKDKPLFIDDRGGITINQITASARKMHKKHNLKLIIVDYLQLVTANANSREQEISKISRALKALAKELNLPVIALSQLNRKCDDRPNKRPNLSDLRDSGAIEQDADIVAFIYRDEVYNENTEQKGVAEINFAKARSFPTGTVYLASRLDINKFDNLEREPTISAGKGSTGGFDYP